MPTTISPANTQLIPQAEYVKKLRPLLPKDAFAPSAHKVTILFINVAILLVGWAIAAQLDHWPIQYLILYLPIALIMGNSVASTGFMAHEILHGYAVKNARLSHYLGFIGFLLSWIPPTLWKTLHNQEHHYKTNSLDDPDRSYLFDEPNTYGKLIQNAWIPSVEVTWPGLIVGLATSWGVYTFRHLTAVLFFNHDQVSYLPASFEVSPKKRRAIAIELLLMFGLHAGIASYLKFSPVQLILGYFLPIAIGYGILIAYIFTNHMLAPLTEINDPLVNSTSIRMPKIIDLLHSNFSYHAEHHIFPTLNSDYYPYVRELIKIHYPDRLGYIWEGKAAWQALMATPRYYKDANTLISLKGDIVVPCPAIHSSHTNSAQDQPNRY